MNALEVVNLVLTLASLVLALVLAAVYWRNHREIRSPFTLGLLLFAAFLVVHNGASLYHFFTMMDTFGDVNEAYLLVENALETGGLVALVMATMR